MFDLPNKIDMSAAKQAVIDFAREATADQSGEEERYAEEKRRQTEEDAEAEFWENLTDEDFDDECIAMLEKQTRDLEEIEDRLEALADQGLIEYEREED